MALKTIYLMQPYWWDGRRLAHGDPQQFRCKKEAQRSAAKAYEHHAGVTIFAITGSPEFDSWGEPRAIETIGHVPTGD